MTETTTATAGLVEPRVDQVRPRSRRRSLALRVLVPLALFGLWWLLTGTGIVAPNVLASPSATASAFWNLVTHDDLLGDIGVSVLRLLVGVAIGSALGLLLGTTSGLFALGEELLDSSLQMLRTIPFPAVIFFFIVWFGIGETAKVALIALATLFPMYLQASNGVRNVDRRVVEAARTFGLRGGRLVGGVIVPLASPAILNGLRFSFGVGILALVIAETDNANQGIGALLYQAYSLQQVANLMVCIILYALIGILIDLIVRLLERQLMPWRRQVAVR